MLYGMVGVVYSLILGPGFDLTFSGDLGRPGPRLIILGFAICCLVGGIGSHRGGGTDTPTPTTNRTAGAPPSLKVGAG